MKETACYTVPKEYLASHKEDDPFINDLLNHICDHLLQEISNRIIQVLDKEKEIIIRLNDLRVEEDLPINSVEYRRIADWKPLIRCKDCKYNLNGPDAGNALCNNYYGMTDQMGFCHLAERRIDERPYKQTGNTRCSEHMGMARIVFADSF